MNVPSVRTLIPPRWRRLKLLKEFTLSQPPTHQTGGLPGFPARDLFAPGGTRVQVPETCELVYRHFIEWDAKKRVGGWTCYLHGQSKNTSFVTHFETLAPEGTYAAGEIIGKVAKVPNKMWAPHIHDGIHTGHYEV